MSYETTANRKRPRSLSALAGQPFVSQTLEHALARGRIAHAYLFSGPRGVGKTSTARILARCLNCESGPTAEPCGSCALCTEIIEGRCLDVVEIDGASHTGVDDIREIKNDVLYPPGSARYKVFIIDEVHMLSNSAFNALLKTIEEPPPYIVFIFATTEVQKLPATVRSRCQQFHFRLIELVELQRLLREACVEGGANAEDEALHWIAREAGGSLRDAYTLFDQVSSLCHGEELRLQDIQQKLGHTSIDDLTRLIDLLVEQHFEAALELVAGLLLNGVAVDQLCVDLADYLHALLLLDAGVDQSSLLGHAADRYSTKARASWKCQQLRYALDRCFDLYQRLRSSLNSRFELELFLHELSDLHRWLSPQQLLEQLQLLRRQLGLDGEDDAKPTLGDGSSVSSGQPRPNKQERMGAKSQQPKRSEPLADAKESAAKGEDPQKGGSTAAASEEKEQLDWAKIVRLCQDHASLAAVLSRSTPRLLADGILELTVKSNYDLDAIKREERMLLPLLSREVTGVESLTFKKIKQEEPPAQGIDDPQLKMVGDVFRGRVEEDDE